MKPLKTPRVRDNVLKKVEKIVFAIEDVDNIVGNFVSDILLNRVWDGVEIRVRTIVSGRVRCKIITFEQLENAYINIT